MRKRTKSLLLALAALAVAAVAVAAVDQEGYRILRTAPGTYRTAGLDGADSADWSAPLDTAGSDASVQPTGGNPTLAVSARFGVSGGTLELRCGLWHNAAGSGFTFLGLADTATLTASTTELDSDGLYLPDRLTYFDTGSATHWELRISDPSASGTVTLVPWTFGAQPSGATAQ